MASIANTVTFPDKSRIQQYLQTHPFGKGLTEDTIDKVATVFDSLVFSREEFCIDTIARVIPTISENSRVIRKVLIPALKDCAENRTPDTVLKTRHFPEYFEIVNYLSESPFSERLTDSLIINVAKTFAERIVSDEGFTTEDIKDSFNFGPEEPLSLNRQEELAQALFNCLHGKPIPKIKLEASLGILANQITIEELLNEGPKSDAETIQRLLEEASC